MSASNQVHTDFICAWTRHKQLCQAQEKLRFQVKTPVIMIQCLLVMLSILFWLYAFFCLSCLFSVSQFFPVYYSLYNLTCPLPGPCDSVRLCPSHHKVLFFIWFDLRFFVAFCLTCFICSFVLVLDSMLFCCFLMIFFCIQLCLNKACFCFPQILPPVCLRLGPPLIFPHNRNTCRHKHSWKMSWCLLDSFMVPPRQMCLFAPLLNANFFFIFVCILLSHLQGGGGQSGVIVWG